jgi:N-acetyl-gamma-glutamyl-phosphate reductase
MVYRAAVLGGSGYTGAELLRLCAGHPELEVVVATAAGNAGSAVGDVYPSLRTAYPQLAYSALDATTLAGLEGLDVVFACLPHGESQAALPPLLDRVAHVVDLGADFRLPPDVYERWYGEPHAAPDLAGRFAYGMTELYRDEVKSARHVAAPGCYPTAASLALAPLLAAGDPVVEPTGIVVSAISGVSGAGRSLKATSLFSEAGEQVSAYGLLTHRHTAEIEQALAHVHGAPVQVLFQPHLAPMTRGILATCYARPAGAGLTTAALLDRYRDFYAGEPFILVVDEPSGTKATFAGNAVHVTARFDDRTGTVVAFGTLDNLVKGASGQMLQDANLLLGLPEAAGLSAVGVAP